MEKICSKCNEHKPILDFSKCSKSKTGLQSQCKSCKVSSVKASPSYNDKEYRRRFDKTRKRQEYHREYHHKTKVARNISRRMRQSLTGARKGTRWTELVSYSLEELKSHLESKFEIGMSWENYGSVWHIDHIKPVASFYITSTVCEDFKLCWALDNLQPLFALDNLRKSNKILH